MSKISIVNPILQSFSPQEVSYSAKPLGRLRKVFHCLIKDCFFFSIHPLVLLSEAFPAHHVVVIAISSGTFVVTLPTGASIKELDPYNSVASSRISSAWLSGLTSG